jgi:flagella basal body P-ring formation protein FlgA
MGRAMSEGGVGDTVTIQNPASFRMIGAVVTGPGTVRATGVIGGFSTNQLTARK